MAAHPTDAELAAFIQAAETPPAALPGWLPEGVTADPLLVGPGGQPGQDDLSPAGSSALAHPPELARLAGLLRPQLAAEPQISKRELARRVSPRFFADGRVRQYGGSFAQQLDDALAYLAQEGAS